MWQVILPHSPLPRVLLLVAGCATCPCGSFSFMLHHLHTEGCISKSNTQQLYCMTPNILFVVSVVFPGLLQWMKKYQSQSWDLKHSLKIPERYMSPRWRKSGLIEPYAWYWFMKDNSSHFSFSIWKLRCATFLNLFQTEHSVKISFRHPVAPSPVKSVWWEGTSVGKRVFHLIAC